jgi:hypothetical protein
MTAKSLHSAVMEVGLYYQKGWSTDHIARFTFRLHRRRLRAQESAARARWAAHPRQARGIAYRIGPSGDPRVEFAEVMAAAEARRGNSRLLDRVRDHLTRRLSRSPQPQHVSGPCWICGQPAALWAYVDGDHRVRLTDGYPTCAQHLSQEAPKQEAPTQVAGTGAS